MIQTPLRVFTILVHLITGRDSVVSREDIIEKVLKKNNLEPGTIDVEISHARKAIGDSGKKKRLIKTIQGKGWRFIGDVVAKESPSTSSPKSATDPPAVDRPPRTGDRPLTPAPEFLPHERVMKIFVGRAGEVERVLSTVRRQRIGQKTRPKPGTSLFWYHGFGGMGKSWLLRRIAFEAAKLKRKKDAKPAVMLVDWAKADKWCPLEASVSDPLEVLKAVAIRATQILDPNLFQSYWGAQQAFEAVSSEWTSIRISRFHSATLVLPSNNSFAEPQEIRPGKDIASIPLISDQCARDRNILREILHNKRLWSNEPSEQLATLNLLQTRGPMQDEVYEAWAGWILPATIPYRAFLVRPYSELAETLIRCLRAAADTRPLLLIFDTCENLNEWTEFWLRKLLAPLLDSSSPIIAVMGGRSHPDRYLLPGERGGWLHRLSGQIEDIPFDRGRYFTVSEIEELLILSETNVEGFDRRIVADRLHRVTRGVPLSLGLSTDKYVNLLEDVMSLGDIAEHELIANKAVIIINEVLAERYLLHVHDHQDLQNICILALIPDSYGDIEEEEEWFFRSRLGSGRWEREKTEIRDDLLKAIWGSRNWRDTLRHLDRSYGMVADGDLHRTIKRCLRNRWRIQEPKELHFECERAVRRTEPDQTERWRLQPTVADLGCMASRR